MSQWDARYNSAEYVFGKEPNEFLKSQAAHIPAGGRVLCLGEGEGRNAVFLAKQGFSVVAVDVSKVGLNKTQRLASESGVTVETICADLSDFKIDTGAWDGVISIWCHLPSELRKRVHTASLRGLKVGGVFILEAYRPEQMALGTGGPKNPDMLYSLDDLKNDLQGMNLLLSKTPERDVQEGEGHSGNSAVVQIVARKEGEL
jgi:SAM-dependent methyltransferase